MDISLKELMEIFDNDDDDEDMTVSTSIDGERPVDDQCAPAATKLTVEVQLGLRDEDESYEKTFKEALQKLSVPPLKDSEYQEVLNDLHTLACIGSKREMQRFYSTILQKTYINIVTIEEIEIKCILRYCGPRIIREQTAWKRDSKPEVGLSDDDIKIIYYLAGATLKWGLKKFTGEENEWCKSQINKSGSLPPEFEMRGRQLIMPCEKFFQLMKEVEYYFRCQFPSHSIDMRGIIAKLNLPKYYPTDQTNYMLVKILIHKYIRGRSHIHCISERRKRLDEKRSKKRDSKSLREYLKQT